MKISTIAIADNGTILEKYTCKGQNINPEIKFEDVPAETKSLALILDDPDAPSGTFTHWVIFNMPPETMAIPENSNPPGMQAQNSASQFAYVGPCPPSGTHRYYFKLYALDCLLDVSAVTNKIDLVSNMQGHILEEAEVMGKFGV
jgi:Raf kinase inhibitor-like YbhB/YbcL family protein